MSQSKSSGLAQLVEGFNRLSERERLLVVVFGFLFISLGGGFVWQQLQAQLDELRLENEALQESLNKLDAQRPTFLALRAERDAQRSLLDSNKVDLSRLMESAAQKQGFSISDFRSSQRFLNEGDRRKRRNRNSNRKTQRVLVQQSQTVTIRNISLDKLSAFLDELEGNRFPIRVNKLDIRTSSRDRQELIEVKLTVSTYKNQEEEA